MKIASFEVYQYTLPLTHPIVINEKKFNSRQGYIIVLKSEEGVEGFGEVAPVPGRSRESLEDCLNQLQKLKNNLQGVEPPRHLERLEGGFEKWFKEMYLKPSVRCGLELALLTLLANVRKVSFRGLLSVENHDHIKMNGLIHDSAGSLSEKMACAKQLIEEGFSAIKLKVGQDIKKEIKIVQELSAMIDGRALLHIDANQGWTLNQAVFFGNEVGLAALAYIEEPLKNIYDIPEFFNQTTIPTALDESLLKYSFDEIKSIDGIYTFVLKPTLLGGIERTSVWMKEARRLAINAVVSSSFESNVGILGLAHLAGSTSRDYPAGLDTLKYFTRDIFKEKLTISRGKMDISKNKFRSADIDFELLTRVDV